MGDVVSFDQNKDKFSPKNILKHFVEKGEEGKYPDGILIVACTDEEISITHSDMLPQETWWLLSVAMEWFRKTHIRCEPQN